MDTHAPPSTLHAELFPPTLRRVLAGSAIVHALLVGLVLLSAALKGERLPPARTVLNTKLVRLGEERPKELLPRKPVEAAPPPAAAVPLTSSSKPEPKAPEVKTATPTLSARERVAQLAATNQALSRLKSRVEPQAGHRDGSPEGELTSIEQAVLGNKYATEIHGCLKRNYAVEGLDQRQLDGKQAVVVVRVDHAGKLVEHQLVTPSGEPRFDAAVLRAVQLCGAVSPPPKEIARELLEHGIEIVFTAQ